MPKVRSKKVARKPRRAVAKKAPKRAAKKLVEAEAAPASTVNEPKTAEIDKVIRSLQKKHGSNIRRYADFGSRGKVSEVISTGLDVLDRYVLGATDGKGNFGNPIGRASEVFSEEGVGKTSYVLGCLREAQEMGGIAAIADSESALDPIYAESAHRVNMSDLVILEAESMESVIEQMLDLMLRIKSMPKLGPMLLAWDSIAATPTLAEIAGLLEDTDEETWQKAKVGERARVLSDAGRKFVSLLKPARTHLMFVNQIREKIGVMFGSNYTTPGGHAVKFLSTQRLQLFPGKAYKDDDDDHLGKSVHFTCIKNKLAPPWRKCEARLDYARGWDNEWTTLKHAKERGLVEPRSRGEKAYLKALQSLGWPEREVPL